MRSPLTAASTHEPPEDGRAVPRPSLRARASRSRLSEFTLGYARLLNRAIYFSAGGDASKQQKLWLTSQWRPPWRGTCRSGRKGWQLPALSLSRLWRYARTPSRTIRAARDACPPFEAPLARCWSADEVSSPSPRITAGTRCRGVRYQEAPRGWHSHRRGSRVRVEEAPQGHQGAQRDEG